MVSFRGLFEITVASAALLGLASTAWGQAVDVPMLETGARGPSTWTSAAYAHQFQVGFDNTFADMERDSVQFVAGHRVELGDDFYAIGNLAYHGTYYHFTNGFDRGHRPSGKPADFRTRRARSFQSGAPSGPRILSGAHAKKRSESATLAGRQSDQPHPGVGLIGLVDRSAPRGPDQPRSLAGFTCTHTARSQHVSQECGTNLVCATHGFQNAIVGSRPPSHGGVVAVRTRLEDSPSNLGEHLLGILRRRFGLGDQALDHLLFPVGEQLGSKQIHGVEMPVEAARSDTQSAGQLRRSERLRPVVCESIHTSEKPVVPPQRLALIRQARLQTASATRSPYGADSVAIEIGTCSLWTLGGNLQLRTLQPQRIARQRDSPEPRPPRGPEPVSHEGGKDG
jgi:hypothetical protein